MRDASQCPADTVDQVGDVPQFVVRRKDHTDGDVSGHDMRALLPRPCRGFSSAPEPRSNSKRRLTAWNPFDDTTRIKQHGRSS